MFPHAGHGASNAMCGPFGWWIRFFLSCALSHIVTAAVAKMQNGMPITIHN
jgi:hypothetical protein